MKITRESIEKSSARMGNGWTLSRYYLVMCGEKAAELQIPMEDGGYIQAESTLTKNGEATRHMTACGSASTPPVTTRRRPPAFMSPTVSVTGWTLTART